MAAGSQSVGPEVGTHCPKKTTVDAATAVLFTMAASGVNPAAGTPGFAGGYQFVVRYRVAEGKAGGGSLYSGAFSFDGLGTYTAIGIHALSNDIDAAAGTPTLSISAVAGGVEIIATGTLGHTIDHVAWVSVMGPPV